MNEESLMSEAEFHHQNREGKENVLGASCKKFSPCKYTIDIKEEREGKICLVLEAQKVSPDKQTPDI